MKINNLIVTIIIGLVSCNEKIPPECTPSGHGHFTFTNNSNRTIVPEIYWNYPDTVFGEYNPLLNGGYFANKNGGQLIEERSRNGCWESILNEAPQHKIWYYIFDVDSLKTIPWETVRKTNRGLLERRLIDIEYLKKNNFIITYP